MKKICFLLMVLMCFGLSSAQQRKTQTRHKPATTQTQARKKTTTARKKTTTKKKATKKSEKEQLQDRRKKISQNIAAQKKRQVELERNVKKRMQDVLVLSNEISEKRRTIDSINSDITNLSAHIELLDSQLVILHQELVERQERYAKSMRYMYRNRKVQNKLMFVLSAQNVNQMYRRMRFMKEYATYQRAQGEAVKQKQAQIENKKEELRNSKSEKTTLLNRGEREKQTLEKQQSEQKKMVASLKKEQKTVASIIAQQQKEEAELNARIERLIQEEIAREKARIEAEKRRLEELARKKKAEEEARKRRIAEAKAREERAREEARIAKNEAEKRAAHERAKRAEEERKTAEKEMVDARKTSPEPKMMVADADAKLSGSFASNKGKLPMPITGPYQLVRSFGSNVVDGMSHVHLSSKGLHLKGQPGASARCVFDGQVTKVFATGKGYIVMVRHGKYISVYSGMESVSVAAGQKVRTNQAIGRLGPTNMMQFQLRNWTELLNPMQWLRR